MTHSRRWRGTAILGALATLAVLPACDARSVSRSGEWAGTVDTLASGRLIVRNPDAPLWHDGEAWQLRERFRIGVADGDGADVFGDIRDVEIGPDGNLYVLDSRAGEVRVFANGGRHVRTFGRTGQGPGELNRAVGFTFDSRGTLWVMNWRNGRYTAFDSTGALVRETRRLASYAMIPWPGRFSRSDELLDVGLGADGEPAILGLDTAFVPRDTLRRPSTDPENLVQFRQGNTLVMSINAPFAPQPSWDAHPDGGIVVGVGDTYRLHRISWKGDTMMTIEVRRDPSPVSAAERDSAAARFREIGRQVDGAKPDHEPRIPTTKPAHDQIFVDDRSNIWVRRIDTPGSPPSWDVIDRDGRFLGTLTVPVEPTSVVPSVRGDLIAVVTEMDDIPTVIVYDIVRR